MISSNSNIIICTIILQAVTLLIIFRQKKKANNYAWEAAAWFWGTNVAEFFENGNEPTEEAVTKKVYGGYSDDMEKRKTVYDNAKEIN